VRFDYFRAYSICRNLTETGFGFGGFMHSSFKSETDLRKPSKPVKESENM